MNTAIDQLNELSHFQMHLTTRGLFDANPHVWVDWNNQLVTFPLWSITGKLVGYQKYNWRAEKLRSNKGKYFTWIPEAHRPYAFWGMEYVVKAKQENSILLVVEGVWDALRAIGAGYNAVAVLTATPPAAFITWFHHITYGLRVVAIRDNDGDNKASHGLDKLVDEGHTVDYMNYKDLGDFRPNEVRQWLNKQLLTPHQRVEWYVDYAT